MKPATFFITAFLLIYPASRAASQIVLSEIMYHAPQSEYYEEFIELYNTSDTASVDLSGWRVGDQIEQDSLVEAGHGLILPPHSFAVVLDPGYWGYSSIYDAVLNQDALLLTINDGAFGYSGLRNNPPDTVMLRDPSGTLVASFCYPPGYPSGYSCEKIRLEWGDDPSNWAICLSYLGTPGSVNSVQPPNLDLAIASLTAYPSPVPFGVSPDLRLVIRNTGMEATPSGEAAIALSAAASNEPETLLKVCDYPAMNPTDSTEITIPGLPLLPGPHKLWAWHSLSDNRPENDSLTVILSCGYAPGMAIINEFMAAPYGENSEWVEIYNPGQSGVDLMGFAFSDLDTADRAVLVDSSLVLGGGDFALLAEDSSIFGLTLPADAKVFVLNNGWPSLNNYGDVLHLFDGGGTIQDEVSYYDWGIPEGRSMERLYPGHPSNDPANWQPSGDSTGATPGRANSFQPPLVSGSGSLAFSPDPFDPDRHGALSISLTPPAGTSSAAVIAFDLRGRRLKVIFDDSVASGPQEILWDGHDRDNRRLAPGLYLMFAEFRDASGHRQSVCKKTLTITGKL